MAAKLWPMQLPTSKPVRYAERDVVGVEAAGLADPLGVNEWQAWLARLEETFLVGHHRGGLHNRLEIARSLLLLSWTESLSAPPGFYLLDDRSYHLGERSGAVASITRLGTGELQIDFASALPSIDIRIGNLTPANPPDRTYAPNRAYVMVQLYQVISDDQIIIRRWEGEDGASMVLTDGPCAFTVHAEG